MASPVSLKHYLHRHRFISIQSQTRTFFKIFLDQLNLCSVLRSCPVLVLLRCICSALASQLFPPHPLIRGSANQPSAQRDKFSRLFCTVPSPSTFLLCSKSRLSTDNAVEKKTLEIYLFCPSRFPMILDYLLHSFQHDCS